jgi:hypothetical protein
MDLPHGHVDGLSPAHAWLRPGPRSNDGPDDQLRSVLGISDVNFVRRNHSLAVVNSTLADMMPK